MGVSWIVENNNKKKKRKKIRDRERGRERERDERLDVVYGVKAEDDLA